MKERKKERKKERQKNIDRQLERKKIEINKKGEEKDNKERKKLKV